MPQHRAIEWLHTYGRRYPKAWEAYASFQERHVALQKAGPHVMLAEGPAQNHFHWPKWCWCPLAAAHAVIAASNPEEVKQGDPLAPLPDTGALGAVAAWRATQGIYRFDPTLFYEVWEAPMKGKLPSEILKRLPEWCCYCEIPIDVRMGGRKVHGFFVHLEYDVIEQTEILRFALDIENFEFLRPVMLHLSETIEEGLENTFQHYKKSILRRYQGDVEWSYLQQVLDSGEWEENCKLVQSLTSVAVFLCCEENDVPAPPPMPERVVRTKKGRSITPNAKKVHVYECGVRIGQNLRWATEQRQKAEASGVATGRTVMPHVRKAHYHHFWRGKRNSEERQLVAHFLPSIQVNFKDAPPTPTLRPVE